MTDEEAMRLALDEARLCLADGDVPIGAVILNPQGNVIGRGRNRREADADPTAHAEIVALREAGETRGQWRLDECTMFVTIEPCTMCAGAIVLSRLSRLVIGAWDDKAGACGSTRDVVRDSRLNHQVSVSAGVLEEECAALTRDFFTTLRNPPEIS